MPALLAILVDAVKVDPACWVFKNQCRQLE
jgi:hypothetical protein